MRIAVSVGLRGRTSRGRDGRLDRQSVLPRPASHVCWHGFRPCMAWSGEEGGCVPTNKHTQAAPNKFGAAPEILARAVVGESPSKSGGSKQARAHLDTDRSIDSAHPPQQPRTGASIDLESQHHAGPAAEGALEGDREAGACVVCVVRGTNQKECGAQRRGRGIVCWDGWDGWSPHVCRSMMPAVETTPPGLSEPLRGAGGGCDSIPLCPLTPPSPSPPDTRRQAEKALGEVLNKVGISQVRIESISTDAHRVVSIIHSIQLHLLIHAEDPGGPERG